MLRTWTSTGPAVAGCRELLRGTLPRRSPPGHRVTWPNPPGPNLAVASLAYSAAFAATLCGSERRFTSVPTSPIFNFAVLSCVLCPGLAASRSQTLCAFVSFFLLGVPCFWPPPDLFIYTVQCPAQSVKPRACSATCFFHFESSVVLLFTASSYTSVNLI